MKAAAYIAAAYVAFNLLVIAAISLSNWYRRRVP